MWWILYLILFIWYVLVLIVMALGVAKLYRMNRVPRAAVTSPAVASPAPAADGVSILRPLKGLDTELYQNLRSSFLFDQPVPVELILCVADSRDPAINVAERLIAEFPEMDAKIMVGDENYGPNPKINNLAKGYKAAKYDLVWVLDSNVAVSPRTLPQALEEFTGNVQLVHNLPAAISTRTGWGGRLEEMYLLTAHSKFYTGINVVGIAPCICGKSNFYRRSDLDRATKAARGEGIRAFASYISEDQLIAEALWAQGGRTRFAYQPVVQPLGATHASAFALRRIRWLRVRKYMVVAATLVEPTTESILAGIMGVAAWCGLRGQPFSPTLFALHMFAWCALDYFNFHNITAFQQFGESPQKAAFTYPEGPRPLGPWLLVWISRELMCLPIWIAAWCGSSIEWRNKPFRIRHDLVAEEIL